MDNACLTFRLEPTTCSGKPRICRGTGAPGASECPALKEKQKILRLGIAQHRRSPSLQDAFVVGVVSLIYSELASRAQVESRLKRESTGVEGSFVLILIAHPALSSFAR